MSRIQTIEPNYHQKQQNRNVIPTMPRRNQNSVDFKGQYWEKLTPELRRTLREESAPQMGFIKRKVKDLSLFLTDHQGEVQTQLGNALFTTTVAPVIIGFNPFADQDEKTKKYTALRQPVSAASAVSLGVAMTMGLDKFWIKLANDGNMKNLDLRISPTEDYLKSKFKSEYNAKRKAGIEELKKFMDQYEPDLEDLDKKVEENKFKGGKATKEYFRACRTKYISDKQGERKELFAKLISENPDNIKMENGIIKINGKEVEIKSKIKGKDTVKLFKDKIPNLQTQEELNEYLKDNNLHNKKMSDFLKDEFKFEFFENGEFKPNSVKQKLDQVKAIDFLERLGLVEKGKLTSEELNKVLSEQYQQDKVIPEINKISNNGENAKSFATALGKDTTRNIHRHSGDSIAKAKNMSLGQLLRQLDYINDDGIKVKDFQNLMSSKVTKALDTFKNHLKDLEVGKKDGKAVKLVSKTLKDFSKNIMTNKAGKLGSHFKVFKDVMGVVTNLPTAVISCYVLNWAYPRFVSAFFPSIAKDDSKKGGNK